MSDRRKEDDDRIRRIFIEEKNIFYDDEWHKSNANIFVEKLNLLATNINFYEDGIIFGRDGGTLSINLRMSCFLKELGDKILENEISSGDLESSRQEFMKLVQDIGRHFEILRDCWCLEKPSEPLKYYEMYRQQIDKEYQKIDKNYNLLADVEKGKYALAKSVHKYDQNERRDLDLIKESMHNEIRDSFNTKYSNTYSFGAGHYLDRLKLRIFLARRLAAIEYFMNGSETKVIKPTTTTTTTEFTDWKIELPPLHSGDEPEIKYGIKKDWDNYVKLASEWDKWLNGKNGYNIADVKTLLKVFLRGNGMVSFFEKEDGIWRKVIEKMFGIDVQRNSSALLINAMFFDLVEMGEYKLSESELLAKLPAFTEEYDLVSSVIAARMNKPILVQKIKNYQKQEDNREGNQFHYKRSIIVGIEEKTQSILYDWLKLKINEESKSTKEGQTEFYFSKICKVEQLKRPEVKNDKQTYGTGVLFHVPTKFFYDLIYEWYAIEIEDLNKDEFLSLYFSEIQQIWKYDDKKKRIIKELKLLNKLKEELEIKTEGSLSEKCTSQTSQVAPSGSKL